MAHVMIIEDEPAIVMVISEMLSDEGYEVTAAYDGLSGLRKLRECKKPDIVLLDLNMPGINGRETVERMRSDAMLRDIPVVLVTGTVYNSVDFPPEGTYQDILEKPFDLLEMLKKIKSISEGRCGFKKIS
ncbi:transcriptional regulatory protein CseB [Oxobacter pfennigii]|uniref:Stage 0 sporulation protein A homolog n=2 Tax=Oxobacter pfennigii TaxID=36849 RepID=A0A0P8WBV2_9CLOT|nr:transcriptional regulatory protein CseB [Oxobacter pfennigii]